MKYPVSRESFLLLLHFLYELIFPPKFSADFSLNILGANNLPQSFGDLRKISIFVVKRVDVIAKFLVVKKYT